MLIINWKKEKNIFDQPEGGERKHLMMKITQVDQKLFNLINPAERNIIMTRKNNQASRRIVI